MTKTTAPEWARHLTDDDEWVVRTALANIASDLDRVADETARGESSYTADALRESATRYRQTLARIDEADA